MTRPTRWKVGPWPAWLMPALASGAATLVAVTVLDLVLADDSDGFDRHRVNPSIPLSSPATTVPDAAGSGPIQLRPDGLEVVDFGQPPDEVIALLSKRLGEPDEDKAQPCQDRANARARWVRWADLSAVFSPDVFVGYIEGTHFPPGRRPALDFSTAKGLSPGDTVERLHQLYGPVPIRRETPQPGQIATKLFTISDARTSDKLSGVLEDQGNKTVVTAIFAGKLC
jgi:hypothetical protein